eukprot:GFYU01000699.1.p1 GENE.GFYU01000699.1~~GFYU01000699.1.p1  ORF type:complete len:142 (+),score=17.41 GFYU01000699.1:275-700(+)
MSREFPDGWRAYLDKPSQYDADPSEYLEEFQDMAGAPYLEKLLMDMFSSLPPGDDSTGGSVNLSSVQTEADRSRYRSRDREERRGSKDPHRSRSSRHRDHGYKRRSPGSEERRRKHRESISAYCIVDSDASPSSSGSADFI